MRKRLPSLAPPCAGPASSAGPPRFPPPARPRAFPRGRGCSLVPAPAPPRQGPLSRSARTGTFALTRTARPVLASEAAATAGAAPGRGVPLPSEGAAPSEAGPPPQVSEATQFRRRAVSFKAVTPRVRGEKSGRWRTCHLSSLDIHIVIDKKIGRLKKSRYISM